jgi:hypothetical protein
VQAVVDANTKLNTVMHEHTVRQIDILMERWDFLQLQCALFVNSDTPGLAKKQDGGRSTRYASLSEPVSCYFPSFCDFPAH